MENELFCYRLLLYYITTCRENEAPLSRQNLPESSIGENVMEQDEFEIIPLELDPAENFEQALFQKIILHEKETATTYRVSLLGRTKETLEMTLSMFSRGDGQDSGPFIRVVAGVPFDGWTTKIPIAIANVNVPSDKDPWVESYSGRGATVGDLFADLKPGNPKDLNPLFPIEVGKILHVFLGPTERATLEEIYRALEWEKCAPWVKQTFQTDKTRLATETLSKISWSFVKEFTQNFGRPPFFGRANSVEIETRKPLEIELFQQKFLLFNKYPLTNGRNLRLQGVLSPNEPEEQLLFELSGEPSKSSPNGPTYFCVTPGKDPIFKLSLKQICQSLSLAEFSERAELCQTRDTGFEQLVFAERAIVGDNSRKLGTKDLFLLSGILSKTTECTFLKERFIDSRGKIHDLVTANLLKISQNSQGNVIRKKEKVVLSDNGNLLTGRYIIGGIDALREAAIKKTLGLRPFGLGER